ncbi:DUF3857 domain-containing protein [Aquimarina algicola]|uniref:DUF3857 domain-containing protein n=1 Tax=Aquimarina algicola TaxID=2589995 RepID=A0A504JBI0_9FLAO|nr:DUF3857 domain-containing protein [Aquimarina algicola]TPN85882.1 DUF3857 domain-containing protein [Aquimarina algicola]
MHKKLLRFFVAILVLVFFKINAQDSNLQTSQINPSLIEEANAIIRSEEIIVDIKSIHSVTIKTKRTITILNKYGNKNADAYESYDPSIKIKKLEAVVYDKNGKEIKKYKKKDFKDRSSYDGVSLMIDDRVKYFEYTPVAYPYTIAFESEVEKNSTAFINSWDPISNYRLGIEKSSYKLLNPSKIKLRIKEINFDGYNVERKKGESDEVFLISNVQPVIPEVLSPLRLERVPRVKVALNDFSLKGIEGHASDWKTFGKWQYDKLILGRDELPQETIEEIKQLVANSKTKKEKARLIYKYVQNKTRYISVQLGIGGWMPFLASDVDRLGYGDCKALTNYTKALLNSQGITSYYTIVHADKKIDIDKEFASMQGNHVILNIPDEQEDIWLECTSQNTPFNFIGDFTDDRNVLVIMPEGGEIKRTKKYGSEDNHYHVDATIHLGTDKKLVSDYIKKSKGLEYDWNYKIQYQNPKDQKLYYKKYWDYLNDLKVNSIKYQDDKSDIVFTEKLNISCEGYTKKVGSRLLVVPNVFSRDQSNFPQYEDRQTSLIIARGYVNTDEYIINLPSGYQINSLPEKRELKTKFGLYTYELEKIKDSQIRFKRYLKITDGTYPKEEYENYRKFRSEIKKIDHSKIVLKQI